MGEITIETYAVMRAEMDVGVLRSEVLHRAGVSIEQWLQVQEGWLEQMGNELELGRFELSNRYSKAFVERQGELLHRQTSVHDESPESLAPMTPVAARQPKTGDFSDVAISLAPAEALPFSGKLKLRAPDSSHVDDPHPDMGRTIEPGTISPFANLNKATPFAGGPPRPRASSAEPPPILFELATPSPGRLRTAAMPMVAPANVVAMPFVPEDGLLRDTAELGPQLSNEVVLPFKQGSAETPSSSDEDPLNQTMGLNASFAGSMISPFAKKAAAAPPLATDLHAADDDAGDTLGGTLDAVSAKRSTLPFASVVPSGGPALAASPTEGPMSTRSPSVPKPEKHGQSVEIALTLEQHASMCAELRTFPHATPAIFERYGLQDEEHRAAVDAHWKTLLADEATYATWSASYWRYVQHWTNKSGA